ncbi:MAG TPA: hypothetical protein ENH82_01310 [bacterium]|nr:hypothetical protein [bacterium]
MSCETTPRLVPRIVGHYIEGEQGTCIECGEAFPLGKMCLVALFYDGTTHSFDLYCRDCFYDMSDGDDEAWEEAEDTEKKIRETLDILENLSLPGTYESGFAGIRRTINDVDFYVMEVSIARLSRARALLKETLPRRGEAED